MTTNNMLYLSILNLLCNFATCVCVCVCVCGFFLLHFQLAIIKDRHNMEKDLTLYHKVKTFIDPEKEAF